MEKFENDFASIFYDKEIDAIVLNYKKQVPAGEFIPVNQKLLDMFRRLKTNRFLVDARNMGVIPVDGQKWVVETLLPGMLQHIGGKKLFHTQVVNPKDIFGKVAASNIRAKAVTESQIVIEAFDSEQEAREWLQAQK